MNLESLITFEESKLREFLDSCPQGNRAIAFCYISSSRNISKNFLRDFKEEIVWSRVHGITHFSESFITEMQDYVPWSVLSRKKNYSHKFLLDNLHYIHWYIYFTTSKVPEYVIDELINKTNFLPRYKSIFAYQELLEEFLIKHIKHVSFYDISLYQKLSIEFIEDYSDRIFWHQLTYNERITLKVKYHFYDKNGQEIHLN